MSRKLEPSFTWGNTAPTKCSFVRTCLFRTVDGDIHLKLHNVARLTKPEEEKYSHWLGGGTSSQEIPKESRLLLGCFVASCIDFIFPCKGEGPKWTTVTLVRRHFRVAVT